MPARSPRGSQKKGRAGELEWLRVLWDGVGRAYPFLAHTRPDDGHHNPIECAHVHVEVKRQERLNIWEACAQAEREAAKAEKLPAVAFRRNRSEWWVAMPASEWLWMLRGGKP